MKQILVMWSGGLDSTYVLWKYLIETDYPIMAHHISLYAKYESRVHQEQTAVDKIKDWLKKNTRDFRYSESAYSNPLGGKDITLVLFTASQICYSFDMVDEIIVNTGWCSADNTYVESLCNQEPLITTARRIFLEGIKELDIPTKLERPLNCMSKREMMDDMPQELVDLTWSCRTPKFINNKAVPCGTCHACIERGE